MTYHQYRILTNPIVWDYLKSRETYDILGSGYTFKLPVQIGDLKLWYSFDFYRLDGESQLLIEHQNNGSVFIRPDESWVHIDIDWNRKMSRYHEEVLMNLSNLMSA